MEGAEDGGQRSGRDGLLVGGVGSGLGLGEGSIRAVVDHRRQPVVAFIVVLVAGRTGGGGCY